MGSQSYNEGLECQMKKLITVVNNGNELQQHLKHRQQQIEDRMESQNSRLNEVQERMEKQQAHLESKIDQMMELISKNSESERAEVNHAFIEDSNSIPLKLSVKSDANISTEHCNHTIDTQFAEEKNNGKFILL